MKTCKDNQCNNEVTGKQVFCSDACRKRTARTMIADMSNSDSNSDTVVMRNGSSIAGMSIDQISDEAIESSPPCTDKQLSSPCHACKEFKDCDYLHNQTTAKPGDADYKGVCVEVDGAMVIA